MLKLAAAGDAERLLPRGESPPSESDWTHVATTIPRQSRIGRSGRTTSQTPNQPLSAKSERARVFFLFRGLLTRA
jgi:hypothetical protein